MIDVSVARLKLHRFKEEKIPRDERWTLCSPDDNTAKGKEQELKKGIRLASFGVKIPALPNDDFKKGTEDLYPKDFNLKVFKDSTKGKGNYEISRERLYFQLDRVIPCHNWVDKNYLHDIMDDLEFLLKPIKISQYGDYFWLVDGTHRLIATHLLGIFVNVDFTTYIDPKKTKVKVRKKK